MSEIRPPANAAEAAYVREHMVDALPPPADTRGPITWMRENLFSGLFNSLLTLAGLAFVLWLASLVLPWLMNSMWNAASLDECRQILAAEGASTGACWGVIKARWHQYMFGFYPMSEHWRPVLAFGLMFVALAPILFWNRPRGAWLVGVVGVVTVIALALMNVPMTGLLAAVIAMACAVAVARLAPKRLIIFTLIYPFLAFFLLWGGSIWRPIAAACGFVILELVVRLLSPRIGVTLATTLGLALAVAFWIMGQGPLTALLDHIGTFRLRAVRSDDFGGFLLAITIGATAITFSLPMGILLALGRRSNMWLIRILSVGFIEFIRGVPLITLLFTASLLLQYFLPPRTNFDLIVRVIILVTFFASAYMAEVVRGGLAALPRGQYEAGDALGLDYWQAQRLIIMPQALKVAIPGIVSTFISLFKDTTLVSFVGLLDPLRGVTQAVRSDMAWKGIYWEPYVFVGAIFFIICFGMSRFSLSLERRLKTDNR